MIATDVVISNILKNYNLEHKKVHVDCTFIRNLDAFAFRMKRTDDSAMLITKYISISQLSYTNMSSLILEHLNDMHDILVRPQQSKSGKKHIKDSTELSGGHLW